MLINYFQLALRHLAKNRTYAAINIIGLAVGIASVLLIFRMVYYEMSFDYFQSKYDRIYRVVTNDFSPTEGENFTPGIPLPVQDVMQQSIPQFERFTRMHQFWPTVTIPDAKGEPLGPKFLTDEERESASFAEADILEILDWQWLGGDPHTGLTAPDCGVINEHSAIKYFGSWQAALGKTILVDNVFPLRIQAVFKDIPVNSDFQFYMLASYETLKKHAKDYNYDPNWGNTSSNDQVYVLLRDVQQFDAANAQLALIGQEHYKENLKTLDKRVHVLQPLSALHFDQDYGGSFGTHATNKSRLWVLSMIGALILAMAAFNFVNLATAQAAKRSREVGVRKSLGGHRYQLIGQFMGETGVIVLFSVVLGGLIAWLSAPFLKYISDVPDQLAFFTNPAVWLFLVATTLLVTFLSGFYPALILSGFEPVRALKNNITAHTIGGVSVRKLLVMLQFIIAQGLIIGTLITVSQMQFLQNMDLGFKPQQVYVIDGISSDSSSLLRFEHFKNELKKIPNVGSVSFSSDVPSSNNNWSSNFALGSSEDAPFSTFMKYVDADYFKTYQIKTIAGRELMPSDTAREVMVNETLLKKLGYSDPQEAIGILFKIGSSKLRPVVGVVKDFTANSAKDPMKPIVILSRQEYYSKAGILIASANVGPTIRQIEATFNQVFPEQVFDGEFMDEKIADFYQDDARFSALCKGFAGLAILISCLGLYGLAALMAAQRTKEIGIRKVLGASVVSILTLLSREFMILVVLAAIIAIPLAYFAMQAWLQDFVYRTTLPWWIFAGTVGLTCLVALITIGIQILSAARSNPVKALRSE
jgi:predicted permease